MKIEKRIQELALVLPDASNPKANYANCVRTGNLLYVSGKGPMAGLPDELNGKIGDKYTVEQGYEYAKATGLDILAVIKLELGSLDRVSRVIKLQGFVNATQDFEQHPKVLNGCSDLMVAVFGDRGVHARSVFGANSLRGNLPIIIDSIFEVAD